MDVLKSGLAPGKTHASALAPGKTHATGPVPGEAHGQNKNPEANASGTCWWLRPASIR